MGSRDINASVACASTGACVARFRPLRAKRCRSVGPLPQILRHSWIIFGEFVVGFALTLQGRLTTSLGVRSSNLFGRASISRSVPDTWVTFHSEDIGNTFGPKGFARGSSLQVSSSKYPRS
jgi:hypothetical protein